MDWWYKNEELKVNDDTIIILKDTIRTVLREGASLAKINLYHDDKFFYIKTTNRISLNHFLSQNDFEEMEKDPKPNLTMIFGE